MNRMIRLAAVASSTVIAVSGLAACGSGNDQKEDSSGSSKSSSADKTPDSTPSAESTSGSGGAEASASATITIKGFEYDVPGSVAPGTKITVKNDDSEAHTVTADSEGDFDVTIPPGKSEMLTAPSDAGSYKFHCTFHSNMRGTLTAG